MAFADEFSLYQALDATVEDTVSKLLSMWFQADVSELNDPLPKHIREGQRQQPRPREAFQAIKQELQMAIQTLEQLESHAQGFMFPQAGDQGSFGIAEARAGLSSGAGSDGEMQQLMLRYQEILDEFASANNLDGKARGALVSLGAAKALRVMGLIGTGNAFVMHGVRNPNAAVMSRMRSLGEGQALGEAFEDWPRLVDGFASVNNLSQTVRDQLKELPRDQALKVIGFTSGLKHVVPPDMSAEHEVVARLERIRSGGSLVPLAPVQPQLQGSNGGFGGFGGNAGGRRARSRSPRRFGGGFGGCGGGGFGGGLGGGALGSGAEQEMAYLLRYVKKHVEIFCEVNGLDERSADALREKEPAVTLRVMGLIGSNNSFLIRGARNVNAAVMSRFNQVLSDGGGHEPPLMNYQRLVEDFIVANPGLDERASEALKKLRREEALAVIGFLAENGFIMRGAKNPGASLMSRIMKVRQQPTSF